MDQNYWMERWIKHEIGFHRDAPYKHLTEYVESQQLEGAKKKALVPLCGKTLDMLWLLKQGFEVTGVELSPIAVEEFFHENKITFQKTKEGPFNCYQSGKLKILQGDFFELPSQDFDFIYDRACLVALPKSMRKKYATHLQHFINDKTKYFLISFSFEDENRGPPFSVSEKEVQELFPFLKKIKSISAKDMPASYNNLRVRLETYSN